MPGSNLTLTAQGFVEPYQLRVSVIPTDAPLPNFDWFAYLASTPGANSIAQANNNHFSTVDSPGLQADTIIFQMVIPAPGTLSVKAKIIVTLLDAQGKTVDAHPDPWGVTISTNPYEFSMMLKLV